MKEQQILQENSFERRDLPGSGLRDLPEMSPEVEAELYKKAAAREYRGTMPPEFTEDKRDTPVQEVQRSNRDIDRIILDGMNDKWHDIGRRLSPQMEAGEELNLNISGHIVNIGKSAAGDVRFEVDGHSQESVFAGRFLEDCRIQMLEALRLRETRMRATKRIPRMFSGEAREDYDKESEGRTLSNMW